MYEDLVKSIQDMITDDVDVAIKINYPTSVSNVKGNSTNTPHVLLSEIDSSYKTIIVGKKLDGTDIIINPAQIVTVEPRNHAELKQRYKL